MNKGLLLINGNLFDSPMKIIWILLLFLFSFQQEIKLGIRGNNTKRFKNLYLPSIQSFKITPFVFPNYKTFVSPDKAVFDYKGVEDLCQDFGKNLKSYRPEIWNNSLITNPCELYFCNSTTPEFLNSTLSKTPGINLPPKDVHYAIQRYCTQCELTLFENFTLNTTCKWFDKDYCNNTCYNSECIFHHHDLSLCFLEKNNIFYWRNDFTHYFLSWLYIYYSSIIVLIINIFTFLLAMIILVIPEIFYSYKRATDTLYTPCQRFTNIFDIRFFMILLMMINILINILLNTFDIVNQFYQTNLFQGRYRNICVLLTAGLALTVFLLMSIQWYLTYRKSQIFDEKTPIIPIIIIIVAIIIFFLWGLLGALLYFIGSAADNQNLIRALGAWLIISSCILALILLFMIISVSKITFTLIRMNSTMDTLEKANYFFSLRLSRFLIAVAISLFLVVLVGVITGIQFLISIDVFTVEFNFIFNCFVCIVCQVPYLVMVIGLSPLRIPTKEIKY